MVMFFFLFAWKDGTGFGGRMTPEARAELITRLSRVVTSRSTLIEFIRNLQQTQSSNLESNGWPESWLESALHEGLDALADRELDWLSRNPIALFELFDAINEELPSCWMERVLEDARALWNSRPGSSDSPART